jgi:hypothetical protein
VAEALKAEGRLLREFDNRSRSVSESTSARDTWEILFLMQHHGVPTRLLDWSRNLLIAAYFAVSDQQAWHDPGDPPAVLVLNTHAWNEKVLGTAGVAGSTGPVTDLSSVSSYQPSYTGTPVGPPREHAVAIAGPEFASRIVAQRGAFSIFGTQAPEGLIPMDEQDAQLTAGTSIAKLALDGDADGWRRALRLVGIGAFTAFPDLDGLARELRDSHL